MSFPFLLSDKTLTVIIDNRTYQTDRSNPHWGQIKEALIDPATTGDYLIGIMKPINAIAKAVEGETRITVEGGNVLFNGEIIHSTLATRILDIVSEGLNIDPWIKFATNVYENPYEWSRQELYLFLEKAQLPITDDGCFIAYKRVRSDYKDIHSGTIDNSVGKLVVMPGGREAVDPDRFRTCSYGLHFCSRDYLPHFGAGVGNRVVLVKINPADVVSIPSDYDNTKGRCFRYEVIGEIPQEEAAKIIWPAISKGYGDYQWGPYEDEEDVEDEWSWDDDDEEDENDGDFDLYVVSAFSVPTVTVPETVIETIGNGTISRQVFSDWQEQYGTLTGIAKARGVSAGTVQYWKTALFGPAK